MQQIYCDEGLITLLGRLVFGDLHFHLFTNNVTIDRSTVLSALTEAAWTGYAAQTVLGAAFAATSIAGHVATALAATIAFANTSGSPQSAYGYYVTDTSDTKILFAANFDGAPVSKASGDYFTVIPIIGDFSSAA